MTSEWRGEEEDMAGEKLLPGLPDDLAYLCLASIPLWQQARLKGVCRAWRETLSARFLFDLRAKIGKQEEFLCVFRDDPALTPGEIFDPRARVWRGLPPMPRDPYSYGLTNFECVGVGSAVLVLGGSLFDARSFPMDRPLASSACFSLDAFTQQWARLADMPTARGSFACAVWRDWVFVAGGGSRHAQFGAGGSRTTAVERYNVREDRWERMQDLSKIRAGCFGFFLRDHFFVMGGYGASRTIAGILPVDHFYLDGEVLCPASTTTDGWRPLEDMWEPGERTRMSSKVTQLGEDVFMLDGSAIFRYNVQHNKWEEQARLPSSLAMADASRRLVALDGELYIIPGPGAPVMKHGSNWEVVVFQVYNLRTGVWRSVATRRALGHTHSAATTAICSIKL